MSIEQVLLRPIEATRLIRS